QAEADKLTELNQAVTDAKDAAKPLVDALPAGDVKDGLNDRLDQVDGITVPAVTDANNDGVNDSDAAAATAAVEKAAAAQTAAKDALDKANEDGVISQAEADKLTELNQAVTDAKDAAKPLVDALPAGDVKDGLNDRLDQVDGITVPAVTDANNDGVNDSDAAAATAAVEKAAAAQTVAKDAKKAAIAKTLPQTGETDSNALSLVGILSLMIGLVPFVKKRQKRDATNDNNE
ncbi:LPXTG cell wall anchor domain-containing protein, partial [Streptococcus suis]